MIGAKERFALGDHPVVAPCRATNRQGSPSEKASRRSAGKLSCLDSGSLVETSSEAGGPVGRPLRHQAYRSIVIGACEIKEVVVLAEPQFVSWFAPHRNQPGACFHAGGVQNQRFLKLHSSFVSLADGAQRPRSGRVQVRSLRVKLHGTVQRLQCIARSSL